MRNCRRYLTLVIVTGCTAIEPGNNRPQAVPVRVEVADAQPFAATVKLLGRVHPEELVTIDVGRGGTIRYPPRFGASLPTGVEVAAGELLATLTHLGLAAEVRERALEAVAAEAEVERTRRGFEAGVLAEIEVAQVELAAQLADQRLRAARAEIARLARHAPCAGQLVIDAPVPAGTEVAAGRVIGAIASSRRRVEAWAAASQRAELRPLLGVTFADSSGRMVGTGALREVAAVVDGRGLVRVVASVHEDAELPAPGEGVEVTVALEVASAAISVPQRAIAVDAQGQGVYVLSSAQRRDRATARRVDVTTGGRAGDRVEVITGLRPGDRVVVEGVGELTDGALVVEVTDGAAGSAP